MGINELMQSHGGATLVRNTRNSNGTSWFCSDGNACNSGVDYRVLIDDTGDWLTAGVTLHDLYSQTDLLEVQVNGVTIY